MKMVTPKQIAKTINLIAESGIDSAQYQMLLRSGRFTALLRDFTDYPAHREPIIKSIRVPVDYTRTLVQMRDAGGYDGRVSPDLNDVNFPVEVRESGEREFFLVCFHRFVDDNEDPTKSELLRELDKRGLKPEGPPELCAIGEHHPELQMDFPIVARRQVWMRPPAGLGLAPVLRAYGGERILELFDAFSWAPGSHFLASRK